MSVEERILNIAEAPNWYDGRELRTIALEVRKMEERIKRLEELGKEIRECASRIGTVASGEGSVIRRTEDAIQAWDKEANQ